MAINTRTTLECDGVGCPTYWQEDISAIDMRSKAREEGWLITHVKDLCPVCRNTPAPTGADHD